MDEQYLDKVTDLVNRLSGRILALEFMQACVIPHIASGFSDPEKFTDRIVRNAKTSLAESTSDAPGYDARRAYAEGYMDIQIQQIKSNLAYLMRLEAEHNEKGG